jgi:hypothetical protein
MIPFRIIGWLLLVTLSLLLTCEVGGTAWGTPQASQRLTATAIKTKKSESTAPSAPSLEAKAVDILKIASNRLATAHTVSFTAVESFESPSRQGHPLVYTTKSEVSLQRPDKLRVIISGDGPASEFYYDGKKMTAFAHTENLIAVADAPPTIDKALEAAYHSAGIYFPFTDLIVTDPYGDMAPGLNLVYYIGQSHVVGDTTTDMVAFAGNGLFAQMWIGTEDKLPRLIHAVYLDDPDGLRHNLFLSDWQIDGTVPDDTFRPSGTANAKTMQFAHPHPESQPGVRPSAKFKSPNSQ